LKIGNNVFISVGATVTQDIEDNFQALGRKVLPKR
jgi:acetyltransferase-like isoleucine patch superfamily enzyme